MSHQQPNRITQTRNNPSISRAELVKRSATEHLKRGRSIGRKKVDPTGEWGDIQALSESAYVHSASEREARRNSAEFRRAAEFARASFAEVFKDWTGPGLGEADRAINEAIEAQIAAASVGAKPLYFDPWGNFAAELAKKLRTQLPPEVEVHADSGNLLIYRLEAVRPFLDRDPSFYRPNDETDQIAVARVSALETNGELLGYGAHEFKPTGGARVTLSNAAGFVQMFFVSNPAEAQFWATERARDIQAWTRRPVEITIEIK